MMLLKHAALTGFRNLTVTFLKKLHAHLQVPWVQGNKPNTEVPLVMALLKFVLGQGVTKQTLEQAMSAREKTGMNAKLVADTFVFGQTDLSDDEECLLIDNDDDVRKQFEKLKAQHEAAQKRDQARRDKMALMQPEAPTLAPKAKSLVTALMTGYTAKEASKWLPQYASLYKDSSRENRWRVRSKFWPEKNYSYGKGSFVNDYGAMKLCILHAWKMEKERIGAECPFEFQ